MKGVTEDSASTNNEKPNPDAAAPKKLSKKQKRRKAQRRHLLTVLAVVAMVAVVVAAVVGYNRWKDGHVETLPSEQRITAVVNGQETEIAPYSACEIDDADCQQQEGQPFELDLQGAKEFTLKLPKDVYDHDWAMLQIFDDPGANTEKYFAADEAQEVTVKLESERTAEDNTTPQVAVVEIHSMLIGLDSNGDQTPYNAVWSITPKP